MTPITAEQIDRALDQSFSTVLQENWHVNADNQQARLLRLELAKRNPQLSQTDREVLALMSDRRPRTRADAALALKGRLSLTSVGESLRRLSKLGCLEVKSVDRVRVYQRNQGRECPARGK